MSNCLLFDERPCAHVSPDSTTSGAIRWFLSQGLEGMSKLNPTRKVGDLTKAGWDAVREERESPNVHFSSILPRFRVYNCHQIPQPREHYNLTAHQSIKLGILRSMKSNSTHQYIRQQENLKITEGRTRRRLESLLTILLIKLQNWGLISWWNVLMGWAL